MLAFKYVCYYHEQIQLGNEIQLLIIILGEAGVGKSYWIKAIQDKLGPHQKVVSYTASASFLVDGMTIHQFFKIPPVK
jgi:ATP-dependent DNA helicase PIF1